MEGSSKLPSDLAWIDLTSTQLPVWLDLQSGTHPSSYIIGGYIRIPGPVDPSRFERAVAAVVARNDALRLRFDLKNPKQIIDFTEYSCVSTIDLSDKADPHDGFRQYLETEFPKPFDLSTRGRLFRISLVRLEAELWFCVLKFHHLVADGMSISLVFRQICDVYNGDAGGAPRRPTYIDFARDDAAYLASDRYRRDLDYWAERFDTVPRPLFSGRIPDHRGIGRGFAPALTWQLPWERYKALAELGKARGTTPFAIFLGLLTATLVRMRGEADLVIGVPVLNRSAASWRDTIGMFAGAMPIRLRVSRMATLHDIVAGASTQLRRDFRHQRAPVSDIVRELGLPQQGRWRLFDVVLSFE
ncbi:MAG: condensation domain-containing protein, partial [Stellaceae bacterium]